MRWLRHWGAGVPANLRGVIRPLRHLGRWATRWPWQRHTITVDMEQGLVRVVVLKGRKVMAWGTTFLDGDAEPQDQGAGPPAGDHVAPLGDLLKELRPRHGRVLPSLPLRVSVLRRLHLPKMGQRYMGEVVSAEVLGTMPFARGEVDIAWQHRRSGTGHEVFAVATPRVVLEEHLVSLRAAGRRPAAAYSRAAALALAIAVPNAMVVDILTALSREPDAVRGLRNGADDYIAKPIRLTELVARAEVALRRVHPAPEEDYRDAALHIDFLRHQVYLDGNPVELSPMEFRLLAALVRNADRVLSVDRLLDLCWGCGEGGPENVRVYIGYLRKKLDDSGRTPRLIETVREFGYRYRPPPRETGAASWPLSSTRYVPLRNQVGV